MDPGGEGDAGEETRDSVSVMGVDNNQQATDDLEACVGEKEIVTLAKEEGTSLESNNAAGNVVSSKTLTNADRDDTDVKDRDAIGGSAAAFLGSGDNDGDHADFVCATENLEPTGDIRDKLFQTHEVGDVASHPVEDKDCDTHKVEALEAHRNDGEPPTLALEEETAEESSQLTELREACAIIVEYDQKMRYDDHHSEAKAEEQMQSVEKPSKQSSSVEAFTLPVVKDQSSNDSTKDETQVLANPGDLKKDLAQNTSYKSSPKEERQRPVDNEGSVVDTELDDFFASCPAGNAKTATAAVHVSSFEMAQSKTEPQIATDLDSGSIQTASHFPALDNVDLETDEELVESDMVEGEQDAGGRSDAKLHEEERMEVESETVLVDRQRDHSGQENNSNNNADVSGKEGDTEGNKGVSKRRKDESGVLIELQPDNITDNSEDDGGRGLVGTRGPTSFLVESDTLNINTNNNNMEAEGLDENNSANGKLHRGTSSKSGRRKDSPSAGRYSSSSYRSRLDDHGAYQSVTDDHSPSRSSYYNDSRDYRSRDGSSLHRLGELSSVDSSRLSTRYTRLERGNSRNATSRPESSSVPRFNTLHDQQVSWLDMFKMIEAQHRNELCSQHAQHERLLQEMQQNMARELSKQQDTLKHSLSAHREILEDLSPGRHRDLRQNKNQSRKFDDVEVSSIDSQKSADPNELPVKRSLESELSSPTRPADTSLGQSRISVGRDKQLRGGVYSSPMPLAKSKHKHSHLVPSSQTATFAVTTQHSPRAAKSTSDGTASSSPRDDKSRYAISATSKLRGDRLEQAFPESTEVSQAESDDLLSPRTRISLREKHARHLADMRAYYEEELGDMRQMLLASQRKLEKSASGGGGSSSSKAHEMVATPQPAGMSAEEKILAKENEELRQRCREMQDECHDAKSEIREQQQKIQGLEIRAADYAERYDQSQAQVLSLGSRLEELTEFAKDKESASADMESKNQRVAESLQLAYKKEKELTESLHSAKTTIQRLVDKYEILEKDYTLLKESNSANQEKLFGSRQEVMETNNKLSRLEMDNKQLQHDNEVLKHELTMARSSLNMRTSYEDSFSPSRERGRVNHGSSASVRTRSMDRTQHNSSATLERRAHQRQASPDEPAQTPPYADDFLRSPILRAEQELRRLQSSIGSAAGVGVTNRDFAPKLQRKFYGTEVSSHTGGSLNNCNRSSYSPSSKSRSPLDKKGRAAPQGRENSGRNKAFTTPQSSSRSSTSTKMEPFNFITERERSEKGVTPGSAEKKLRGNIPEKDHSSSSRAFPSTNGMSSEQAMERIKSGDIVSRPEWEDGYTSLAPSRSDSSKISDRTPTRDQMLQERVRNIDSLEKKYDDLVTQKRKYESSLSKLPAHGHRGEKERLEGELDRLDKELGSVRMSLKRFHVLKSTI